MIYQNLAQITQFRQKCRVFKILKVQGFVFYGVGNGDLLGGFDSGPSNTNKKDSFGDFGGFTSGGNDNGFNPSNRTGGSSGNNKSVTPPSTLNTQGPAVNWMLLWLRVFRTIRGIRDL